MNRIFILTVAFFSLAACSTSESTTPGADSDSPSSETETNLKETVTYNDEGFSPATLTVKAGTTVTFQNDSLEAFRPASADHPTHGVYPTTGGCAGSTFDACKNVQPGDPWSFKFDEVGTWEYHDHLHPEDTGTITVE